MKQIIKNVLTDVAGRQINLDSKAARDMLADLLTAALKTHGTYKQHTLDELELAEEREKWICDICGGNTFEVEYDYLGSGTNHLGCELNEVRP
tara:strand:+ start:61 stop:339 length:279 start_codon:yes stop_codon:yes gene_type:complete